MSKKKQTPASLMWKRMSYNKWSKYNFNIDYSSSNRNCECDYICRCSTITNAHVERVDLNLIRAELVKLGPKDRPVLEYAIDRLIRVAELYQPGVWDVGIVSGYYGEEIGDVELDYGIFDQLMADIELASQLPLNGVVEFLLVKEYGYLLDRVTNRNWEIREVPVTQLAIPNTHYAGKVKNDKKVYDHYNLPIGVYVEDGNRLALVDGYHRYVECILQQNRDTVKVIVGK